jgi:DNA-binding MurR/RpiR family transcriptional regulator
MSGETGTTPESVSTRILRLLDALRPSERKVARVLLANYPSAALDTAARLAADAGVSTPSVLRFAQALGFGGYPGLQEALRHELTQQANAPINRPAARPSPAGPASLLAAGAELTVRSALDSLAALPPSQVQALVGLLGDPSRRVFLTGGRTSRVLATSLRVSLEQIRTKVWEMNDPYGSDLGQLVDIRRRDVHVVFDVSRYQRNVINAAAHSHDRGATVALITDKQLSPAAATADVVLPVSIDSSSAFGSLVAATLLTELIVPLVLAELGERGQAHLRLWESFHSRDVLP